MWVEGGGGMTPLLVVLESVFFFLLCFFFCFSFSEGAVLDCFLPYGLTVSLCCPPTKEPLRFDMTPTPTEAGVIVTIAEALPSTSRQTMLFL